MPERRVSDRRTAPGRFPEVLDSRARGTNRIHQRVPILRYLAHHNINNIHRHPVTVQTVIYYLNSTPREKDGMLSSPGAGQEEYEGKFGDPQSMRRIVPPK